MLREVTGQKHSKVPAWTFRRLSSSVWDLGLFHAVKTAHSKQKLSLGSRPRQRQLRPRGCGLQPLEGLQSEFGDFLVNRKTNSWRFAFLKVATSGFQLGSAEAQGKLCELRASLPHLKVSSHLRESWDQCPGCGKAVDRTHSV